MLRLSAVVTLFLFSALPTANAQTVDDGIAAIENGEYEAAKSILVPLAQSGNAKAMNAIGIMHSDEKEYSQDPKVACDWYEKAAIAGYAPAQRNLGFCYKNGTGRPQNISDAIVWLKQSANQGSLDAQIELLSLLYDQKKYPQAQHWGNKAAEKGNALAKFMLWGTSELEGEAPTLTESACVVTMIYLLEKDYTHCD